MDFGALGGLSPLVVADPVPSSEQSSVLGTIDSSPETRILQPAAVRPLREILGQG